MINKMLEKQIHNARHGGKIIFPVMVASLLAFSNGAAANGMGEAFDTAASSLGETYGELSSGSKFTMVLLNHGKTTEKYFKDNTNDIDGMDRQYEWGQSVGLFFRSGKTPLFNSPVNINFNLGYSYMFKLGASYPGDVHNWNGGEKIFISEDCFWSGGEPYKGQYKCNESSPYGKVPVANIKLDWGKNKQNRGFMKIGDGFYNTGMITTATDDDALLSSYRGITAQHSYNGYIIDGAYVIGFMSGNEDKMQDLRGNANYYEPDPLNYDYLYTMRLRKKFSDQGGYQIAYGEAKDYLRRSHAAAYYNLKINPQTKLFMQAQYYYNHKAGDLWDIDVEKEIAAFDEYASFIEYEFILKYDAMQFLYAFSKTNAPRENGSGNGAFSYGFGKAKGYLNQATSGNYHGFRRDGEEAMVLGVKYDFRHFDLRDMNIQYRYHWGKAPVKNKTSGDIEYGKEYEHAITFSYEPKSGMLKGFVFNLKQAFYRPDETLGQLQPGDISTKADKTATKFIVAYMFSLK